MTQLCHTHMGFATKRAGRTFRAKCGHIINKGKIYGTFDDSCNYTRVHDSYCPECAEKKVGVALEVSA